MQKAASQRVLLLNKLERNAITGCPLASLGLYMYGMNAVLPFFEYLQAYIKL